MMDILESAKQIKTLGLKWTALLSKHSVAMYHAAEDRNEVAGRVYETRKALDCALMHMEAAARRIFAPTEDETEDDTLQICYLHGLQVND